VVPPMRPVTWATTVPRPPWMPRAGHLGGGEPEGGAHLNSMEDGPLSKWPGGGRSSPMRSGVPREGGRRQLGGIDGLVGLEGGLDRGGGRAQGAGQLGRRGHRPEWSHEDGTDDSSPQTSPQRSGVVGGEEEAAAGLRRRAGLDPSHPGAVVRSVSTLWSCSRRASAPSGPPRGWRGWDRPGRPGRA